MVMWLVVERIYVGSVETTDLVIVEVRPLVCVQLGLMRVSLF